MLMLSIILVYPLFQYETYWQDKTAFETAADLLYLNREGNLNFYLDEIINFLSYDTIVYIKMGN